MTSAQARRTSTGRAVSPYVGLVSITLALNLVVGVGAATARPGLTEARDLALTATAVNLLLAVVFRQQYIVNALFWLATRAPLSWPLPVRAGLAKVYQSRSGPGGGSHPLPTGRRSSR